VYLQDTYMNQQGSYYCTIS